MSKFTSLEPQEAKKIENEALKKYAKEPGNGKKLLPGVIARFRSVFPFHLFPDEIIIKKDTITYIERWGPGMERSRKMQVDDVAQVEADCGPIFGHVHVYPKLRTEEPILIERLWKKDALEVEEIIEEMIETGHKKHESTY